MVGHCDSASNIRDEMHCTILLAFVSDSLQKYA